MKTILRQALKILGSAQLLRQSCPHCLWSFKLSKTTLRFKNALNRITLMRQIAGEHYKNQYRSRQCLVPQRTSTGRQGLLLLFSQTLRLSSSRWEVLFIFHIVVDNVKNQSLRRNSNYGPDAQPTHWVRPTKGTGPKSQLKVQSLI